MHQIFPGVYSLGGKEFATLSLAPGIKVYGEDTIRQGASEYRAWNPFRSKLGAAIAKGIQKLPIGPGSNVLYLGAASGTTASHVSDLVGANGIVLCVEFAPRTMRDLVKVCEQRPNMLPMLNDARLTDDYADVVNDACGGAVDVVFEDVSDPEQARILIANARFLRKGGIAMIAVKARSISGTGDVKKIFAQVEEQLLAADFKLIEKLDLEPFELDHEMLVLEKI
jgi:fibrillarin-like pre-rRNA processing protein